VGELVCSIHALDAMREIETEIEAGQCTIYIYIPTLCLSRICNICMYMYKYIYIHMYIYIHVNTYICIYASMYVCIYIFISIYIYLSIYVSVVHDTCISRAPKWESSSAQFTHWTPCARSRPRLNLVNELYVHSPLIVYA